MHNSTNETAKPGNPAIKILVLIAVVGLAIFGYLKFGSTLSLDNLATKESALRKYQGNNPILVIGIAFLIYVAVTGLTLPFAVVLTLVIGWFFGFWQALILVSFASTAGSTLAFLSSRFILRDSIQAKFGNYLTRFNEALDKEGAFYLFSLRLIPYIPFWIINLVMGLTPIRVSTFWWVSQIGMLPGTAIFVYTGASFPSLKELADRGLSGILSLELGLAFVLLSTFPLIAKQLLTKFKQMNPGTDAS